MTDASWNLQVAIKTALDAITSKVDNWVVYDDVPDLAAGAEAPDSSFPYVQIGETDAVADDVQSAAGGRDDGETETVTLHVWSRYAGQKQVKQIMQQIKNALHDTQLSVTARASALATVGSRRNFLDPDGRTRHGVMTVQVVHRN